MGVYGLRPVTIDSDYDFSTIPFVFEPIQVSSKHLLLQINGTNLSGTLNFEQSIDASS